MKLQEKLNVFVANQTVLYTKLHNLHWYVTWSTILRFTRKI